MSVTDFAIRLGDIQLAGLLLDAGAPLDPRTMLLATSYGHAAMMRFVLDRGARLDAQEGLDTEALRLVIDLAIERDATDVAFRAGEAVRRALQPDQQAPKRHSSGSNFAIIGPGKLERQ